MKLVIVIQARVASTRFPGKVLKPLVGRPLLFRMIERVRANNTTAEIVVATTTSPKDDAIGRICSDASVPCYRGHPTDLVDRHIQVGRAYEADAIVKIPSDCPLIDPAIIDRVLSAFLAAPAGTDYVSNLHPATYPDGNDVEVVTMEALEATFREARRPYEREHTTPFVWDQPERFRCENVVWETALDYSMSHRFTIDYAEDYSFVRAVFEELWSPAHPVFSLEQILELVEARPFIRALNAKYAGVNWYRHNLADLRTVRPRETRFCGEGAE